MEPYKFFIFFSTVVVIVLSAGLMPLNERDRSIPANNMDSSLFTANLSGGWSIYSFYLNQDVADSVEFELILKQDDNINWHQEQWIGTIQGSLVPNKEQKLIYYLLLFNSWNIRIAPDGKCFLNIKEGAAPTKNPVIIPIKIKYKNN